MAKTKKPKSRSVKKKTVQDKKPVISEFGGFKLGDKVWYTTASGTIGYGKIDVFYPNDNHGPVIQVCDEINYGSRCGLLENASYDPPKGGKARLSRVKGREARDAVKKK